MPYVPSREEDLKTQLTQKYRTARMNLLAAIIFTVVNIILALTGSDVMFLFSMTVPYMMTLAALANPGTIIVPILAILIVGILAVYVVCWFFSGKRYEWIWGAIVLFALDTLYMIYFYFHVGIMGEAMIDIAFHIYVMVFLVMALVHGINLKTISKQESSAPQPAPQEAMPQEKGEAQREAGTDTAVPDSPVLREADMGVKARVLVAAQVEGLDIVFRRVKRVSELVIDGKVYGEWEALIESAHALTAVVSGHRIQAGFDGAAHSFIYVDGNLIATKLRLI